MATIIQVYNHTAQLFMSGQCPPGSAYKCELLNEISTVSSCVFAAVTPVNSLLSATNSGSGTSSSTDDDAEDQLAE